MGKRKRLRELIVITGFIGGLFMAIGISPQMILLNASSNLLHSVIPDGPVFLLFIVLPVILLTWTLFSIYSSGGVRGLVAVGMAFIAGLVILTYPIPGVLLLVAALVAGYFATR
jgi:hypothetical protein